MKNTALSKLHIFVQFEYLQFLLNFCESYKLRAQIFLHFDLPKHNSHVILETKYLGVILETYLQYLLSHGTNP